MFGDFRAFRRAAGFEQYLTEDESYAPSSHQFDPLARVWMERFGVWRHLSVYEINRDNVDQVGRHVHRELGILEVQMSCSRENDGCAILLTLLLLIA